MSTPAVPPPPTRPALNREYLATAALALIDGEGLRKFSMRRLGTVLGVDPMAARHFQDQEALLDGIAEALFAEMDADSLPWMAPWPNWPRSTAAGCAACYCDTRMPFRYSPPDPCVHRRRSRQAYARWPSCKTTACHRRPHYASCDACGNTPSGTRSAFRSFNWGRSRRPPEAQQRRRAIQPVGPGSRRDRTGRPFRARSAGHAPRLRASSGPHPR